MDPRNFLYDPYVFQFELHTFNVTIHSLAGIREMVKGTFLDADIETEGLSGSYDKTAIPETTSDNIIYPWQQNAIPISGFTNSADIEK